MSTSPFSSKTPSGAADPRRTPAYRLSLGGSVSIVLMQRGPCFLGVPYHTLSAFSSLGFPVPWRKGFDGETPFRAVCSEVIFLSAHCLALGLFIFVPGLLSLVLGRPTSVRVPAQETGLKSNQLLVGYSQTLHHHCPLAYLAGGNMKGSFVFSRGAETCPSKTRQEAWQNVDGYYTESVACFQ